jgi:two-component system sensor histidine kinase MtrB
VIEPVDLGWFLGQLVRAHGWSETVRIGGGASAAGPLIVYADRRRVERIVVNLVENALLHGAAPVTVTPLRTADPASGELVAQIAVTDSGPGIPPQHLPHVFDRFYKADPSRSSGRGSGLGLAIARENARLLGGDLTAANVPRGGARFVVTLPASEQSAPGYPAGADETDGAPSGS